jgi:hypothetical protein
VELLPFVVFGIAFAGLVAWLLAKERAERASRMRALGRLGFAPCPEETDALAEAVARHENESGYHYRIADPMRASVEGHPIWFYEKERARRGSGVAAYEVRLPLECCSPEGLVLFFKPSALAPGTTATWIGSLATAGWDSQPDDLVRLDVPVDLQATNLIGVLAPAGASLYDLIAPKQLTALQPVADHGVLVVTCRDGWCSLATATTRTTLDIDGLWPIVRQLVIH